MRIQCSSDSNMSCHQYKGQCSHGTDAHGVHHIVVLYGLCIGSISIGFARNIDSSPYGNLGLLWWGSPVSLCSATSLLSTSLEVAPSVLKAQGAC